MRIFFSAGEPSGDQHAAHLIETLRQRDSTLVAEGFGGPAMAASNCSLLFELTQLAVMGFVKVLPMLARFRHLVIQAEEHFDRSPPDAVVLVDFPGFNWWIAKAAKSRGIPVYYYLPPQLWAWAPWRIRKMKRTVDHVLCGLPFEYDWYRERGVNASWVGHPFFDEVAAKQLNHEGMAQMKTNRPLIGVLPGSRDNEVLRNFPVMLQAIQEVATQAPDTKFIVGAYKQSHVDTCEQMQKAAGIQADIEYFIAATSEVIESADCCLMVSGSISLELLARHTPGIVLYRVARAEQWAARIFQTCPYITLTNLIAGRPIMPEFVSSGNPAAHVRQISAWLVENCTEPETLASRQAEMKALAEQAAITGSGSRAADILITELTAKPNAGTDRPTQKVA